MTLSIFVVNLFRWAESASLRAEGRVDMRRGTSRWIPSARSSEIFGMLKVAESQRSRGRGEEGRRVQEDGNRRFGRAVAVKDR